jgi:two-component system C4-dicarboxylate transport sensor histidine kinase DctB
VHTNLEALTTHRGRMLALACALAVVAGAGVAWYSHASLARERLALLRLDAQRHAIETGALTLNGKLMGAIAVLGRLAPELRQAATPSGGGAAEVSALLSNVARLHGQDGIDGIFVADATGLITAGWYASGESSVGLKIGFRPYFKTALAGRDNVYAAVSLSNKGRALYYAAPVTVDASPAGVIVARTNLERMDAVLANVGTGRHALLLSPQGVVFASSRQEWLGMVAGELTPEAIRKIREVRQFGAMFDRQTPHALPFRPVNGMGTVLGERYAMSLMPVEWHDPAGKWQLAVMEDLGQSAPLAAAIIPAAMAALVAWLLAMSSMLVMRSSHSRRRAVRQVESVVQEQAGRAQRTMQLAECGLRLQQATSVADLVQAFLHESQQLFGALQGSVYLHEAGPDGPRLVLAGSYAGGATLAPRLLLGEGMLGQCALEQRPLLLDGEASCSPWRIASGLGESAPATLLLAPVLLQSRLLGAVELALLARPEQPRYEQFLAAVELFALNLEIKRLAADANAVAG